jgi:hypothetical protein
MFGRLRRRRRTPRVRRRAGAATAVEDGDQAPEEQPVDDHVTDTTLVTAD